MNNNNHNNINQMHIKKMPCQVNMSKAKLIKKFQQINKWN